MAVKRTTKSFNLACFIISGIINLNIVRTGTLISDFTEYNVLTYIIMQDVNATLGKTVILKLRDQPVGTLTFIQLSYIIGDCYITISIELSH